MTPVRVRSSSTALTNGRVMALSPPRYISSGLDRAHLPGLPRRRASRACPVLRPASSPHRRRRRRRGQCPIHRGRWRTGRTDHAPPTESGSARLGESDACDDGTPTTRMSGSLDSAAQPGVGARPEGVDDGHSGFSQHRGRRPRSRAAV